MKAELDVQAGITDGKEGESGGDFAPMAVWLTGAVRISTHLFSDELPSGSLQEEQKPLSHPSLFPPALTVPKSPLHRGTLFSDQCLKNGFKKRQSFMLIREGGRLTTTFRN